MSFKLTQNKMLWLIVGAVLIANIAVTPLVTSFIQGIINSLFGGGKITPKEGEEPTILT